MDYYASSSEEGDVEAVASPAVEPCAPASSCGIEGLPAHAAASSRQEADAADAIDGADAATAARSKPVDVGPSSTLSAEGARLHVTIEVRAAFACLPESLIWTHKLRDAWCLVLVNSNISMVRRHQHWC